MAGTLALGASLAACGTPAKDWVQVYGTLEHPNPSWWLVRPAGNARIARQTFAALTISTRGYRDVRLRVAVRTLRRLRSPAPNPWEVGWVLWDFTDKVHFYYVALKPNGWEIGKEDPAYPGAQRFLATGADPRFAPGHSYTVAVTQRGARLDVSADGKLLASIDDMQRPYLAGRIGLYSEDAEALFHVLSLSGS